MRRFPDYVVTTYVPQVVQGTADAPGRYRVLAPLVIDAITTATGGSPMIVFLVVRFWLIYAALVAVHLFLRNWFAPLVATGGTSLLAALLPLTYTNSWAHPDSVVELLLVSAGCSLIVSKRDAWFSIVLIVAAFNRETSGFLLLLWAWSRLAEARSPAMLLRVAGVAGAWLAVFIGLRWFRGFASYEYWMLPHNLGALLPLPANFDPYVRISGVLWLFLSVPLFVLAFAGIARAGWSSVLRARDGGGRQPRADGIPDLVGAGVEDLRAAAAAACPSGPDRTGRRTVCARRSLSTSGTAAP